MKPIMLALLLTLASCTSKEEFESQRWQHEAKYYVCTPEETDNMQKIYELCANETLGYNETHCFDRAQTAACLKEIKQ